ncbi:MAG TPA: NfeD family protein [Dongiaceae bacterium]|jgi:membrane protein implicated in regulation of membrane protease activity|nr:MAG: NfeD family protein [Variovorax sp.]HEU4825821.1 NfeD family protein [Dongiaceae bacterium]
MANSTFWWLVSGGTIVLELLSGTIYLLLLGIGFAAAALVAHAGFGIGAQILAAAVVGVGSVAVWYVIRRRRPAAAPSRANRDVNLDIGSHVHIERWNADGTASVRYRGAQWTAVARDGTAPAPGEHRVGEIVGSRLVVDRL